MESTLDEVREELARIHDELLDLPREAFARRYELRQRQSALRQKSRELIEKQPQHNAETLRAELKRLQDLRDRMLEAHLAYSSTSVGDAGIESDFTAAVNKAIDAGIGIDEVEARLERILRQLRRSL